MPGSICLTNSPNSCLLRSLAKSDDLHANTEIETRFSSLVPCNTTCLPAAMGQIRTSKLVWPRSHRACCRSLAARFASSELSCAAWPDFPQRHASLLLPPPLLLRLLLQYLHRALLPPFFLLPLPLSPPSASQAPRAVGSMMVVGRPPLAQHHSSQSWLAREESSVAKVVGASPMLAPPRGMVSWPRLWWCSLRCCYASRWAGRASS